MYPTPTAKNTIQPNIGSVPMSCSLKDENEITLSQKTENSGTGHCQGFHHEVPGPEEMYRLQRDGCGPVVPCKPCFRPTAFPTLDDPRQAQPQGTSTTERSKLSDFDEEGTSLDANEVTPAPNHEDGSSKSDLRAMKASIDNAQQEVQDKHNITISTDAERCIDRPEKHPSTVIYPSIDADLPTTGAQHKRQLRPQHNGTSQSIWNDNIRRMEYVGGLSDLDRNLMEMMPSEDEEENDTQHQQEASPSWKDISPAHKLQLYQLVAEAYPSDEWSQLLCLEESDMQELTELISKHDKQFRREEANAEKHRTEIHERYMRGAFVSEKIFRESLQRNIYEHFEDDDDMFDLSTASRVEQARAYLRHCRLDPKLLDGTWADITTANAAGTNHLINNIVQRDSHDLKKTTVSPPDANATQSSPYHQHRSPRVRKSNKKNERTSRHFAIATPPTDETPTTPRSTKRLENARHETSFLSVPPRPGARPRKLTEKALEAKAAADLHTAIGSKKRQSGGSTRKK